ncbi:MAG TPA: sigma-70 family RNA polymerase sigma factor [Terriglobia bacterium]
MTGAGEITRLLIELKGGNPQAQSELIPLVYEELRRVARSYMRGERAGHTLQPTALVNEAYLRLVEGPAINWQNRAHFFAVAAQLMRRVLVDHARARRAVKRGGNECRVSMDAALAFTGGKDADVLALDEALDRLAERDPRQARIVEIRFFGGLSEQETAEVLGISTRTVKRDWSVARAWLYKEIKKGGD